MDKLQIHMNPVKQQIGSLQAEAEIGGPKHEIVCTQQSWVLGMPALHILRSSPLPLMSIPFTWLLPL
jgi:hypothetical protein